MFFHKFMKREQMILGGVFTAMGLGTMLFPQSVYDLGFRKEYLNSVLMSPAMRLTICCFGSQATLCGLTILSTKWDSSSYRNFGLLMIPYFVFDIYFYSIGALTALGAVGDGVGNVIFTICCYYGHQNCRKEEKEIGL